MSELLYRDEPSHDGEVCNDCGRGYDDIYYVDDDLWALLHERAPGGTLCPSCLIRRALASQNQALQERAEKAEAALDAIRRATGDYPNDRVAVLRQRLYEIDRLANAALSPTQETDRPDIEEIGRGIARDFGKTFDILAKADRPTQETDPE